MENHDFSRRFANVARLYGEDVFAQIRHAHVAVVGLGGVGSWAAESLVRSGIGALTLIDLDDVGISNTNRQLHALEPFYGLPKIEVLKERFLNIAPEIKINLVEDWITTENCARLLPENLTGILDCTDDLAAKIALMLYAKTHQKPCVVSGGAGGKMNPTCITAADLSQAFNDPLLASLRSRLRRDYGFAKAGKKMNVPVVFSTEVLKRPAACSSGHLNCAGLGSCMMVTAGFGLALANRLIQFWQT